MRRHVARIATTPVPSPRLDIGHPLTIELDAYEDSTVRFETRMEAYAEARDEIRRQYPEAVFKDFPSPDQYVKAVLASGIILIANQEEVEQLVDRYSNPDLMAGHPPVFAGFDTNLLPWRIDRILGLRDLDEGVDYVNGFVFSSGVRDELDWDYKVHDTDPFVDAFGDSYEEYWNQPQGSARIVRLGLLRYRNIRDIQQGAEIKCQEGDEAIVEGYGEYENEHHEDVLLFSNDRNFVERARSHTIMAECIDFPDDLLRKKSATCRELEHLVYMLAVVFGIVELPAVTVHGVWRGKDELDWQRERLKLDCRSTTLGPKLEGDLSILESYDELRLE